MRLDILARNAVLGVALAGLMTAGAAQAQDKDAAKDAAKADKAAAKDARKDAKVKKAKKRKKGDRDPNASTNKTKGRHLAYGHRH